MRIQRRKMRVCSQCPETFWTTRTHQDTCSVRCRKAKSRRKGLPNPLKGQTKFPPKYRPEPLTHSAGTEKETRRRRLTGTVGTSETTTTEQKTAKRQRNRKRNKPLGAAKGQSVTKKSVRASKAKLASSKTPKRANGSNLTLKTVQNPPKVETARRVSKASNPVIEAENSIK